MASIIGEDHASMVLAADLSRRVEALESGAEDESGQRVTISADQVLTEGVEIGGISIGANRVAFYAPENDVGDKVTVTPIVESGTRIANIKVGNTTTSLFAPTADINGKLNKPANEGTAGQVLATNGNGGTYWANAGSGEQGGGSTVSVTQELTDGVKIATINVDGNNTELFAPAGGEGGGGGSYIVEGTDGPYELLKEIILSEDVSSIVISTDSEGDTLTLVDGFYIEAKFELASTDKARYFNVSIGDANSQTNVPISTNHALNSDRFTYADIYSKQIAPGRWLTETHTKNAMYDGASGVGTSVGNLSYNNWNAFNNPPEVANRVVISYDTKNYGRNTRIRLFGHKTSVVPPTPSGDDSDVVDVGKAGFMVLKS